MPFTDQQIEQFRSYGEAACADAIDAMTPEQQADLAQSVAAYNARKASQQQAQPKDTISQFSNTEYSRPAQKAPIVQQRDSSIDTYLAKNKVNYNMPGTGPAGMETSDPSLLAPEAWQREVKDFRLSNGAVTKVRSDRALWLDPSKGDPNKVPGWYWWTGSGWKVAPPRPYGQEPDIAQLAANAPQVAWQQAKNIGHDIAETAQEFKEKPMESTATALATGLHEAAMPIKQATGLGLMGNYGAGRLIGVIPSEEKSKQWESELDKRGYHRLANAVRDYRENTNAMWESGKQLAMGADPALSDSQQQELKEAQQTKPGEAGGLGGGLVSFLGPMGIAESAGAKVASTGMKLLPRIAARLGQGALTSAPHAFREYNDIKQQLIENGESEEDAEFQALQQAAKDFGVSAPTTALLFSEKFGKAFMPTTKAMAFANRAARTGIITSAQVGLSNIVNDRPVTDNFMSTLLQNGVFEMSHVFGDAKMGKRGAEIAKKYASLEEAKKALQADYVLAVMDHDAFRTKDTKTDLNNAIADLATLNTWGDRLKFNGNLTAEEASKTQGGIKTLARRSVKLAEMGKGGTGEPAKPTEAIAPQQTASTEPETVSEKPVLPEGEPNAVQEQGAREVGAQPRGTEGVGEQAGGVRQGQQGVEATGTEGAKPEVLAQGEEGKVAYRFNYSPDAKSINSKEWFHGTGTEGLSERNLDVTQTKESGLLGQGVYLTDDPSIAKKYARTRGKRTGSENVYSADINISNAYDMEKKPDGWLIKSLDDALGSAEHSEHGPNEYQKEFREWAKQNPDASAVEAYGEMSRLMSELSHENRIPSYEVGEIIGDTFNSSLLREGYDAITHEGGKTLGGDRHQVVILLDPSNIYGLRGEGHNPVRRFEIKRQPQEGKVANHPESSSVQKGEAGFISKEMLGMDPELYKAIYGIAIKKMGLPEGATPADIANHVMGKIKTLGNNVAETTAKILTQIKGITRDAASRLAQILHDNFSVQGERNNITLEEGGKNGAERGRPGTLEVSGREKPTEDRPAEISESQEGRVARQTRLDATDAGSPTLLGPNLSLIEHHSVESKAVKTPRLGYDAVFFHSPDGSIAVVAARDGKRAYVTGNVESNGDITIGELEGNKVKGVGTDLIQTLVREANERFPETRGKETKGYAEGSTEEGPEGIHRMFNRFKSTLWSEDHKVSVLSDDISDSQFKHVESVKPEDVKSQIRDFYAGDANKYNRADLYKNPDIWTSKTPEEVNDFLLKHSEAKLDVKDPQFLADTFGGQHVYERIIKKMGLPEDASLRQIGEFTMDKIKSLGKTVAETTNKILSRVAGIGRQAAEKLAQFLHNEWESFKSRDRQQGAVTMGNLKKKAVKIATQQLSDEVITSVKPEDRTRAENMARMGLYAGEGSKYWKNMTPEQQKGIVEAQDAFIAQTKKALASFNPTSKFGRVRKTSAEYDRSRAIAFAAKKYIDLRNDTLVEMERAGKIKLDPVERLNIHATQQLSDGLFADVSGKTLKEQRKYAQHLHRELARHSQGLDFATKHAANEVLNSQAGIDGNVAKEAYDFMDRVNAGLPVEESKLSKEAKDYIEKFVKPMQQINNGLYQGGQDMVGGDTVKDTAHIPHKFIGVVDEEGNIQPANKSMGLYRMRGIKPGAKNEIARTVEAGITEKGQRLILNLKGDELASVWENGERIGTAHKTKNEAGEEVWTFREKGAYGKPIEMKLGRATIEEIEKNTPFRYAHNPVVALTDSIVGLSEASRAKAMIDALVTSNMVRHPMDAPKGWVELELSNVKGMMAPPDIASVLNDFHRSLNRRKDSSELVRAAKQMGRAFVNLGFINPMVHMPNVIAHGVTGRGAMAWLKPKSYASVAAALESSMESMGDTRSNRLIRKWHDRLMAAVGVNVDPFRNRVFRNLVGLSGRMMNLDPKRTISLKSYNRIMGETIDAQPEAAKNLFEKYGIKSMDAVKEAVNDMSDKVWMADNMVRSTMYLDAIAKAGVPVERMAGELTAKERELAQRAVEQVDRDGYPDYDIPAVGTMGRLGAHMKDSPLWLFTRFHWNTVKLVKNDTVDALKSINPKAWATPEGRKEIYHAADKVAAYVLMSAVIYPIMDMVYQKATGLDEEEIEFRRGGAFGAGHAVAGLFSGEQRAVGKFMNHMFTPSLPFSMGMDLYNSATSPMTGEEIGSLAKLRKTGEDIADNDFTGAAGDLGSFVMDVPEYLFFKAFSPAGTIRQGMKDYKGVQREDSEKAKAVLAAMFMGKVKNPNAEMRTEKNYQRALKKIAKEEGND